MRPVQGLDPGVDANLKLGEQALDQVQPEL
jgi:hypothetical protein